MNLSCGPAADRVAAVQEHLQQADDPGVMEFDSGIADRTDSHGQSQPLQQGKVHRDMEAWSLETGEAVRDDLKPVPHGVEMIKPFLQAEVPQIVGAQFVAQEAGELLVPLEEGVFPVGAEDMMAVFDRIDDRDQFSAEPLMHDEGPQNLVADVEVVMREAAPLVGDKAVVGVLRGILWHADAERATQFR